MINSQSIVSQGGAFIAKCNADGLTRWVNMHSFENEFVMQVFIGIMKKAGLRVRLDYDSRAPECFVIISRQCE